MPLRAVLTAVELCLHCFRCVVSSTRAPCSGYERFVRLLPLSALDTPYVLQVSASDER